jgi:hypothetical protein
VEAGIDPVTKVRERPRRQLRLLGPDGACGTSLSTAGHRAHGRARRAGLRGPGAEVRSLSSGEAAGDDPFDGQTLEWATTSPAPYDNFAEVHIVQSAEPLLDLKPANRSDA